ncbi:hypothetical protein SteCoe_33783 [Stentor coeruleus]|uniref:Glutathione transferase n=1 Tax=Stentor coeruleus TaxID=5963 RepID=A0A1R2AW15_9CILI|nr:hypothetical protein SteCoe_33783 [Stentor coeruleus]
MALVLHYFDGWGRAERTRWLLMSYNIDYTEKLYEWEEWLKLRSSIEFGQLPALEIDGHLIIQSIAIDKYIARKIGIVPTDTYQEYLIESLLLYFDDLFREYANFLIYASDLQGFIKYYNEELKDCLKWVENRIEANGNNGFVVGNSRTLADFVVAEFIIDIFLSGPRKGTLSPLIEAGNPKLVEFSRNFLASNISVATRVQTRADKDY